MEAESPVVPDKLSTSYFGLTKTATYGFLSALPLILLYEILIIFTNRGNAAPIRISSEVWLRQWTNYVEGPTLLILGGILVLIGIAIVLFERDKKIKLKFTYFLGIILESSLYAVLVAILVSQVITAIFPVGAFAVTAYTPQIEDQSILMKIALSIGAGIYEELLFRVILVGGLYSLLRLLFRTKTVGYVIAALIGALLFSAIHYMGSLGDDFTLSSFFFRFFFGLALNVLFLVRGFGIAAWTHALYDIMVVTNFFG